MTTYEASRDSQLLLPEVVNVTPEYANEALTTCSFDRQRVLRPRWIAELAQIITAGNWEVTCITFVFCKADNRQYLVDGYHRLSAIVQSGLCAPLLVFHQTCDTKEQVGVIYSRLDRGLPRSINDGLIAQDMPKQTDLSATALRAGVAAVNVIRAGFRHDSALNSRRGYDEKFALVREWVPQIHAFSQTVVGGDGMIRRRLYSASVMSVGLTVFKHQPDKARKFFQGLSGAVDLQEGSPRHTMYIKVLQKDAQVRKVGVATLCRNAASCWNAFYEGKTLHKIRPSDTANAIVLLGTPYTDWKSRNEKPTS